MTPLSLLKKALCMPLHWQISLAMVLGLATSIILNDILQISEGPWVTTFQLMGILFMKLLKMIIIPLVFSSIIMGVVSVGDATGLGRVGLKTFFYFMLSSLIALFVGLALCNLIKPGENLTLTNPTALSGGEPPTPASTLEVLVRMVPANPLQAMIEGNMLAIIFFSLVLGVSILALSREHQDRLVPVIDAFLHAIMKMTTGVIRLAPIGVFGLIFQAWREIGSLDMFTAIGKYMATITLGLILHLFIVLPVILWVFAKRSPVQHFRHMLEAMFTAFSTSSSSATLPVTMRCVEQNCEVPNRISSFVLPLGSTINMDATALYQGAGVLFIAQALGLDLHVGQQITLVVTALLASVGAAGIPSSGLVMIFIVLEAIGIPGDRAGLIVGAMLAVDRPLDMARTVVNIFGDSVGAVIVAHSEKT